MYVLSTAISIVLTKRKWLYSNINFSVDYSFFTMLIWYHSRGKTVKESHSNDREMISRRDCILNIPNAF